MNDVARCCMPDCDNLVSRISQIPLCRLCGVKVALVHVNDAELYAEVRREAAQRRDEHRQAKRCRDQEQSVVYYLDLGDHIKIGYTAHLKRRISELRRDPCHLLAIEPGSRALEALRHLQFASDRVGAREEFQRSAPLLEHIAGVRATGDFPTWANVPDMSIKIL